MLYSITGNPQWTKCKCMRCSHLDSSHPESHAEPGGLFTSCARCACCSARHVIIGASKEVQTYNRGPPRTGAFRFIGTKGVSLYVAFYQARVLRAFITGVVHTEEAIRASKRRCHGNCVPTWVRGSPGYLLYARRRRLHIGAVTGGRRRVLGSADSLSRGGQ